MKKGGTTLGKLTIRDVPLEGETVLVRADYNVPMTEDGKISNDFRIRASLPTLRYLLDRGCKIIIISHLGRPEGREAKYSLEPIAQRLAELLSEPVRFVSDCIGDRTKMAVKRAPKHSITMLENVRFYTEEEKNDREFARKIARATAARYFVQDGFGVVHRAHASTAAITEFLPSVAGLLLEREVTTIVDALRAPKRPLVAILGGAKVSDKIAVVETLVDRADQMLIGGAMANTFLAADGHDMGASKVEADQFSTVKATQKRIDKKVGDKAADFLHLPTDVAVAKSLDGKRKNVALDKVAKDDLALDIGDVTIEVYAEQLKHAKTVIWNGTMGYAENPEFAHGSARMALALAQNPNIVSIVGGGDTADFVLEWDARDGGSFTHVSTGGGASLELMAGEKLPGIEALLSAPKR